MTKKEKRNCIDTIDTSLAALNDNECLNADDIIEVLLNYLSAKDIIKYWDISDIIDAADIDNDDLLDRLEGTWTLDHYIDNIVDERVEDIQYEKEEELSKLADELLKVSKNISFNDMSADDAKKKFYDFLGIPSYTANWETSSQFKKFKEKLAKSSFK